MRRLLAILCTAGVAACSSTKPAPAPTTPLPAPTTEPSAPPASKMDLVSAITASGREEPEGLDWGADGEKPASQLFKNVMVLPDLTGNRFMAAMQSMKANLGRKCGLCHDPQNWPSDDKPEKTTARKMIRMAYQIDQDFFHGEARVTCFTCHAGHEKPDPLPEKLQDHAPSSPRPVLSDADKAKPAEQVYKNIQSLKGLPAGKIDTVMGFFTAELNVDCTFCHVDGKWALDDKKPKRRAREMLAMTGMIAKTYYDGGHSPVNCWTCHKGTKEPARTPPPSP
jgi:hypothetical protein